MPTANEEILDAAIVRLHRLERYKASEVRRMIAQLNKSDSALAERIAARLANIQGRGVLSKTETGRLEKLLTDIRDTKTELASALYEEQRTELTDFAEHEADFKAGMIEKAATSAGVTVELARPSLTQLKATVTARPFQGRILRDWYASLGEGQGQKISDAIKIGITEGQTTDQIVRAIRGTRAAHYGDGILQAGRRDLEAVVRTAVTHVANAASEALYAENEDLVQGVQWVATLDSRTTAICASRDGKIYKIGQGPRPPAHWRCRSTTVPYLGASSGTRASQFGPVPRTTTYEEWLRRQPAAFQDETLGKGKAQLFRQDKLPLTRFVDPTGKEYTLQQLKQLNA